MADNYKMDGHKLKWHLERVNEWVKGEKIAPLYIDMGITQTCNINCKYCSYGVSKNKTNHIIPTDALIRFLADAADLGVKAIGFLGDGETLIHPGVYDAVIAGARYGLDMAIATNGITMKDMRLKEFLSALKWIRFTISAATPVTYASVMGTDKRKFYKVIQNIKKCVRIKKENNYPVTIGMQMVLIKECSDEVALFAKLGKELGVDYAVVKQCSEMATIKHGLIVDDYSQFEPLFKEAEQYSDENYRVIIKRKKMKKKKREYDQCFGCEFLPQINGRGDLYNCGNFFGNKSYYIGNIIENSFKDIVMSEKYSEIMEKVKNEVLVNKACGTGCRQNEINEFLWAIRNPPAHVNFI